MADLTLNEYSGLKEEEIMLKLLEEQNIILRSNHDYKPATELQSHGNETRKFIKIMHFISRYLKPIPFKKLPVLKREQLY
jgi:hypothetical protein